MVRRKDPVHLYYNFILVLGMICLAEEGDFDVLASAKTESPVKYLSYYS